MNKLLTAITVTAGFLCGLLIVFLKIGVEVVFASVGIYYISKGLMVDPLTFVESWRVGGGLLIALTVVKQALK